MPCPRSDRDRQTCSRAAPDHLRGRRMDCVRCIRDWSDTEVMRGRRSKNKRRRVSLFRKRSPRCESIREYILRLLSDKRRRLQYHWDSDEEREGDALKMARGKDLRWRSIRECRAW